MHNVPSSAPSQNELFQYHLLSYRIKFQSYFWRLGLVSALSEQNFPAFHIIITWQIIEFIEGEWQKTVTNWDTVIKIQKIAWKWETDLVDTSIFMLEWKTEFFREIM